LRVAGAQYPLDAVADLDAFARKLDRWVADGAGTGARLLLFPEYGAMEIAAVAGAEAASSLTRSLAAAADRLDAVDHIHADAARRHGVYLLAASGPRRRADGAFVNAARLITPSGAIGVQDKIIMTPFEHAWGIVGGGPLRVFETAIGKLAIAICYDSEFPLLVRAQVEAGADLLLVPSCTEFLSGWHRVRTGASARALENQIAAVTSPTVGLAPWSPAVDRNTGASGIYVPPDKSLSLTGVIAEGIVDTPGWVAGDIDFDALAALRAAGEMRNRTDWDLQPGAAAFAPGTVEVVRLD
jgi:predicted amidohydrolase